MTHTPQYIKIKEYIIENIKHGKYRPGEKIPSEKDLGEIFNVSRITATTAIRDLVNEGVVYRIQGKGTFVSKKKEENIRSHKTYGFENDSTLNQGYHKTLSTKKIIAGPILSQKIKIAEDEELYEVIRIKIIDEKVNALEYVYLPVKYYLSLDIEDKAVKLIHDLVQKYCFLSQKRVKVYIEPILLSEEQAKIIGTDMDKPLLLWEKFTYSEEEKIIEYSKNIINSELYKFYMDLDI
ncbi:MAG: GntR family transcriptional regulator [Tissierellales bacterium]|jgi:GntR family transcriptional regulator|nr:GntR family transcriptional regulator [Tissierellales bacterium]MBN2826500.1 GntR family transcriptional regulator [Tissierellales bacterium]